MNDNSRHIHFLKVAKELSKYSKCQSIQVCSLFVRDNRIISTGLNGSPKGFTNCDDLFDEYYVKTDSAIRKLHHNFSDSCEIHAEMNAIIYAATEDIKLNNCICYVTLEPCNNCIKHIAAVGVTEVYYSDKYDLSNKCEFNDKYIRSKMKIQHINIGD